MEFISPVYDVKPVPIEKIVPNTYNPNAVAPPELELLYDSIKEDGYTMPVVCYYSSKDDLYVINKPLAQRMASTVRHNRARGTHDVDLMGNIVRELHDLGRSDAWISKHLGMDKDEILRLKQITGLAALFKDINFGQAWVPEENTEYEKEKELQIIG